MLDFEFATQAEICQEIGARLKRQRLAQLLSQREVAARAGVSVAAVSKLEGKGLSSLDTLVRITATLGLVDQLASLFQLQVRSIAEMERNEIAQSRSRAPSRRHR